MPDVTEHFRGSGFKVFAGMIEKDPKVRVWAIPAPTGGSRAFCDRMNSWAQGEGQPGLGYIFLGGEGGQATRRRGPSPRTSGPSARARSNSSSASRTATRCSSPPATRRSFYKFAGVARDRIGQELKLVDESKFALAWIVDFPFYEWNEEDKKIDFSHNPFSMPQGGGEALDAAKSDEERLKLKAYQYDIVCNGYEIASGSVRNHRPDTMVKAFEITGLDAGRRRVALRRPLPRLPVRRAAARRHGGRHRPHRHAADRGKTVREVSLFPMNQQANDLLMGAPSEVPPKQLRELSIRVVAPEKKE